ncbi:hypothetical protein X975_17831, partial [Stegodyphus mimosarum]
NEGELSKNVSLCSPCNLHCLELLIGTSNWNVNVG